MPDRLATNTSYWSSGLVAVLGAMTLNQWGMIIGTLIGLFTAVVNWWYKRESLKLDARRTQAIEDAKSLVVIDDHEAER